MTDQDLTPQDVIASLREQGIDVIRVSYPDMIGVDRGRDVLLDELRPALGHGLPFCRAIFHTSPQGDVVPVAGGLDAGLPDVLVRPDLGTITTMPMGAGHGLGHRGRLHPRTATRTPSRPAWCCARPRPRWPAWASRR